MIFMGNIDVNINLIMLITSFAFDIVYIYVPVYLNIRHISNIDLFFVLCSTILKQELANLEPHAGFIILKTRLGLPEELP